jgi:outer membrane protein assembly factor BamB
MDGNVKWQKDLGRMQTKNSFGEGSSPALHGNTLVVLWDHEGPDFIAAFDAATGEEKWRTPREEDTTWATPLVVEHDGKAQVVVPATGRVRSYDLQTGEQVWETEGLTPNAIPSPVAGDGMVYVMSGFKGSKLLAIKLGRTGDLTGTDSIVWTHGRQTPYVPSPLLYDDRLYFFASNNAMLSVFDAKTGKPLVNGERIDGPEGVYASPVGAGGRVYLVGRNGTTAVIKHADKLEELATNVLDERIDASPAVAGKELFLRGQEHLYCIAAE